MRLKVIILGAAGGISKKLTQLLIGEETIELVLYGRDVTKRLKMEHNKRVKLIDGDFENLDGIEDELKDADFVYLNAMENLKHTQSVVNTLEKYNTVRFIGASMAGIENEVPKKLSEWTKKQLPMSYRVGEIESAKWVKKSNLNYTLLRLTWLYNGGANDAYELVPEGKIFKNTEVSREAVAQFLYDMITDNEQEQYTKKSIGIGEPGTYGDKPSFYS